MQAMGFAMFINLLFVAFFRWRSSTPIDCQAYLLTLNIAVFFCLGLALIRNQRSFLARRHLACSFADCWHSRRLLVVAGIALGRDPKLEWNLSFAVFRSLFFVAWLVRDLQYLQWMSLRRGKHTLAIGVLFLFIFYVCVNVVMAAFGFYTVEGRVSFRVLCSLAHLFAGPCRMGLTPRDLVSSFCCAVDPHRRVHWPPAENSC